MTARKLWTAIAAAALLAVCSPPAPAQGLSGSPGKGYAYKLCSRAGAPIATTATTDAAMANCRVPAGALGADGCLIIFSNWVAVGQLTTPVIRFSATSGTSGNAALGTGLSAGQEGRDIRWICNVGPNNQQMFGGSYMAGVRVAGINTAFVPTAADSFVNFSGSVVAGGTLTLADYTVLVQP